MPDPHAKPVLAYSALPVIRRQIYSPAVALAAVLTAGLIAGALGVIAPKFAAVLSDFAISAPSVVQGVLDLSSRFSEGWWVALVLAAAMVPFVGIWGPRTERWAILLILIFGGVVLGTVGITFFVTFRALITL
jgi:type II secretory pathway component PulF